MTNASQNLRGSAFMTVSMAAFVFNDASIKALSDELPLFQTVFLRGIATSLMMLVMVKFSGGPGFALPRRDWAIVGIRTAAEVGATFFFLAALFNMPLANATAILQALPLAVTMAGAIFFGEVVGWRRWAAIGMGFVGVMMVIQPGAQGFNIFSIYVLAAVGFVTVRDLASRRLSRQAPSMTVATIGALSVTLGGGLFSLGETWVQPSMVAWAQLGAASVFIIGGYLFSIKAMRIGDISAVTPWRYTSLIWALLLGWLAFGSWPDSLTLMGAATVVAAGIFTLLRERRIGLHSRQK